MKIAFNWLKEYINTDKAPEEVAQLLTDCGLEVESTEIFQSVKGGLEGIVIGEVLTVEKHPDAEKLSLTTVNTGNGNILNIVCGAPNVKAGQKVLVATIGTTIYKGEDSFVIKKSKIRGSVSEGMICAEDELGLGSSHEGIMVLDAAATVGMKAKDYLKITDDTIFEIGLTPNRPDATSHYGVARDLNAVLSVSGFKFQVSSSNENIQNSKFIIQNSVSLPSVEGFGVDNKDRVIAVEVEDRSACPRYSGITITGFKVADSPEWLANRLKSIGLRPINNIVDITNFVMMECGQPLHAFDAEQIKGNKVVIKKLAKGSKFITLDEAERTLSGDDLMICNAEEGMCIAGVFGGLHSGINDKTNTLFLESAYFDPKTVRKTAKFHGLSTDSSFRFERGADPNMTIYALKRAAMLIKEIAGGQISSDIVDIYPEPVKNAVVNVNIDNINKLIGKTIDRKIIITILESLGIEILEGAADQNNVQLTLSVPPFKSDVKREADIIEEVLRIYGYNNIELPSEVKLSLNYSSKNLKETLQNKISNYLVFNSYYEIYCNSLTRSIYTEAVSDFKTEENVKMLNPISKDLNVMRQTLLFGGLETIVHNYNRKIHDLKLFEFGNVYQYSPKSEVGSQKYSQNNNIKGAHENASLSSEVGSPQKEAKSEERNAKSGVANYNEEYHLSLLMTGKEFNESWKTGDAQADFFDMKYHVSNILKYAGINVSELKSNNIANSIYESGLIYTDNSDSEIISLGVLNRNVLKLMDIKTNVLYADINWDKLIMLSQKNTIKYKELPKYPEVRRDIAMLIDKAIQYADIEKLAYQTERKLLKKVDLFDVYEGEKIDKDKKSYAISLILQDNEKTLTDKEVDKVIDRIKSNLINSFKATIR